MHPQSIFAPAGDTQPQDPSAHKACAKEAILMYNKGHLHGLVEAVKALERQIPILRDIMYPPGNGPFTKLDVAGMELFDQAMVVMLSAVKIEAVEFMARAAAEGRKLDADDIHYLIPPEQYAKI